MMKIKKWWQIIRIVVTVLLFLPLIYLGVSFGVSYRADKLKYKKIENYYHADSESFDAIVEDFKSCYKENLYEIKFNYNNTYLDYKLKHADSNGETVYSSEKKDCSDASFIRKLSKLREKYQKNCEYPVFSDIYAYYDKRGKMLLYMQVYNERISAEEKGCYYLVYIEEDYSGNGSSLGIDSYGTIDREPFTDNWYTWSRERPFG